MARNLTFSNGSKKRTVSDRLMLARLSQKLGLPKLSPRQRQSGGVRLSTELLPLELWEVILESLSYDLVSLCACALTCRAMDLCVRRILKRGLDLRSFFGYERCLNNFLLDPSLPESIQTLSVCARPLTESDGRLHHWYDSPDTENSLSLFYAAIRDLSEQLPNLDEVRLVAALPFQNWPLEVLKGTFLRVRRLTISGWTFDRRTDLIECLQTHSQVTHLVLGPTKCLVPGQQVQIPLTLPLLAYLEVNFRGKYPVPLAAMLLAPQVNFQCLEALNLARIYLQPAVTEVISAILSATSKTLRHLRLHVCGSAAIRDKELRLNTCIELETLFVSYSRELADSDELAILEDHGDVDTSLLLFELLTGLQSPKLKRFTLVNMTPSAQLWSPISGVLVTSRGEYHHERLLTLVVQARSYKKTAYTMQKELGVAAKAHSWQLKCTPQTMFNEQEAWKTSTQLAITFYRGS